MDLTDYYTFEFLIAVFAGFMGGLIRGFTGFGANLIWAPALIMVIDPVQAVAIMALVGTFSSVQIAVPASKHVNWREIYPIILASWITVPIGIWALYSLPPDNIKRFIGAFIILIVLILFSGWRYTGARNGVRGRLAQSVTGAIAGLFSGFGGIGGPIPVLYFMASKSPAHIQRANNVIAVTALIPMVIIVLTLNGAITQATLINSFVLFFPFSLGVFLGTRGFKISRPGFFRKIILTLLLIIGLSSLLF